MPVGDIRVDALSIGSLDLTDPSECNFIGFNVYENLFDPYGPSAEIKVNDYNDALGRHNINGKEDIKIAFSLADSGESANFNFKCFENRDLDDRSERIYGSLKSKEYEIRCISPEYLEAQARGNIKKSYDMPIHQSIEDLVKKTGFMSKKPYICDDLTKAKVRHIATGHPIAIYQQLNERAVSIMNKSSAYVLFVSNNKYRYCTIEQLCRQSPVVHLVQRTTLGAGSTYSEKLNSITDIKVTTSFYTPPRAKSLTKQATYDPVTGKATYPELLPVNNFKHLGNPVYRENGGIVPPRFTQIAYTQHDRSNNKESTDIAQARQNRASYLAYLAQNHADITIPGNPKIKLGDVIHITIPNKSNVVRGTEKQFSGPVLVTNIRHIIHPLTFTPRYQMRLRVTKAGGYEEGGE